MKTLILNARVIDPASGTDARMDILIENGRISQMAPGLSGFSGDARVIDAEGLVAAPGLVDMHCHLRDPGFTHKEDIRTGTAAAAAGGFTSVACMPNTKPVIDSEETLRYVLDKAARQGAVRVYPIAAVSMGQLGETLSPFQTLKNAGAVAFSDDGRPVMDEALMKSAVRLAHSLGTAVISHCEDFTVFQEGALNEGEMSRVLRLPGIPAAAEEKMVEREARLSLETGARVHIAHISTAGSVEIVRAYKKRGAPVTCETCPHYMLLDERATQGYNTLAKMNPPLRTQHDVQAILGGLLDGTIDAIATDHAPHSREEKHVPFVDAPNGVIGFETALPAALTALYCTGKAGLREILRLLTQGPADILKIDRGRLAPGLDADIVLFDPEESRVISADRFLSKSANSCFIGMRLTGVIRYTLVGGQVVFEDGAPKA